MIKQAKRVEALYESLKKVEDMPREALKHLWDAALVLRAKHHPDHLPEPERERVLANGTAPTAAPAIGPHVGQTAPIGFSAETGWQSSEES